MQGILLFAHGSRNPAWAAHFERLRETVAQSAPKVQIGLCYLELCTPDFAEGVAALVGTGVTDIRVVPVFLAPGKHTEVDLPELVSIAANAHPQVRLQVSATLLEDAAMVKMIATAVAAQA